MDELRQTVHALPNAGKALDAAVYLQPARQSKGCLSLKLSCLNQRQQQLQQEHLNLLDRYVQTALCQQP